MPAGVHAQHPKAVAKQRDDLVPHRKVGAQRVEQQQGRRACPAIGPPIKPSSLSLGKRHEVLRLAIAAKCAAISPCAFLFVIRKFGGAVNRWILSCQQAFSGLGPQTMVSGKAEPDRKSTRMHSSHSCESSMPSSD